MVSFGYFEAKHNIDDYDILPTICISSLQNKLWRAGSYISDDVLHVDLLEYTVK